MTEDKRKDAPPEVPADPPKVPTAQNGDGKPDEHRPLSADNVTVEVMQTIGFGGIVIRPVIDDSGRGQGRKPIIRPVKAVIPARLAESYGPAYVKIIGAASAGAKLGAIEQGK